MYKRELYLKKIRPFINTPIIKVITGMRRSGKSYFLRQIEEEINVKNEQTLFINKESLDFDFIQNYEDLYEYVQRKFLEVKGKKYLFIDEVQEIRSWEKAVVSFFTNGDIDIYITGSNAHLLSSELATFLSGRYVEIPMYTLGFREFLQFRDKKCESNEKEFQRFLRFGGFPVLHHFDFQEDVVYQYVESIYNTILLKDIVEKKHIRNVDLFARITHFVFDNIGSFVSAKKISDFLKSQHLTVGNETVQNYVKFLEEAFVLYAARRYDIKGKRFLESNEKFFLGDIGMRHAVLGYREKDISGLLENIVYLELLRRGYKVSVGRLKNLEIDFIAEKNEKKIYIQVAYILQTPETIEREVRSLLSMTDNYPKYIVSTDTLIDNDIHGIKRLHIIDFLLSLEY